MIWAQTLYIGCGMSKCDRSRNPLANIIVCNYAPGFVLVAFAADDPFLSDNLFYRGNTAYVGQNPYATPYELASSASSATGQTVPPRPQT